MNVRINPYLASLVFALCACTKLQELPSANSGTGEDASIAEPVGGNGGSGGDGLAEGGQGGTIEPDAGPPPCPAGTVGCACNGMQCNDGLRCDNAMCSSLTCGDGKQDPGEACDKGSANDDGSYGGCSKNCALGPYCGDGVKNGSESCDDGNKDDSDLCSNGCVSCASRAGSLACGNRCLSGVSCCSGEQCAAPSCAGNMFTAARTCDGGGKCPGAVAAECGSGFSCDGNLCRSGCSSDAQCAAGRTCLGGACIVKGCGNGVIEAPETCEDGNSIDDDGCSNGCLKCANRTGYRECSVDGTTKCLANAVCCPGTTCRLAGCAGINQTPAQLCNAKGECPVAAGTACASNLICEGSSCRTSCGSDAHCLNGRKCHVGNCIVPACGNGVVEPGESCDNGNSNADSASCGNDCKTCANRGRKECGGVCLAPDQCCGDADCPAASTSGKCNVTTKQCWKRVSGVKFSPIATGYCQRDMGETFCFDYPYLHVSYHFTGSTLTDHRWGAARFAPALPSGAVIERARLNLVSLNAPPAAPFGSFGGLTLRASPCNRSSIAGFSDCRTQVTGNSAEICPIVNNATCSGDVTQDLRGGATDFVFDFEPEPRATVSVSYKDLVLEVEYLLP